MGTRILRKYPFSIATSRLNEAFDITVLFFPRPFNLPAFADIQTRETVGKLGERIQRLVSKINHVRVSLSPSRTKEYTNDCLRFPFDELQSILIKYRPYRRTLRIRI